MNHREQAREHTPWTDLDSPDNLRDDADDYEDALIADMARQRGATKPVPIPHFPPRRA